MMSRPLVILESHPVQYHAPVYRLAAQAGVPVLVVYGSDFSVAGYRDREFGTSFAWDTDLLSGYESRFIRKVADGGAASAEAMTDDGVEAILDTLDPAAVMVVGYSSRFDRGCIRAARRLGRPILFRAETTDHGRRRSWWKQLARDWTLRRLYRHFSRLLYIGERSLAHYRRLGVPDQKLIRSAYCVDTEPFRLGEYERAKVRGTVRAALDLADDRIAILFSGKLVHRKGVDLLVPALRKLPTEMADRAVLVFLGDGELRESIAEQARVANVSVRFLGFQNQSRLSDYYHAADLLVLPSREGETWGLVVNEALHHGLPVVASDGVGSVPDLVKPGLTGEWCESGSCDSLSDAIRRVWPILGTAELRERCRELVGGYTTALAAASIARAYQDVAT